MTMQQNDPYASMPEPKSAGDYPDRLIFTAPGQSIEGTLIDTRWKEPTPDKKGCQILDVRTPAGATWSVFCGPTSLAREVYAKRPPIGSFIRVTFNGYDGQAKLFTLDVAPGAGQAPAPQAAPAPAPDPFAQPQPAPVAQPQPAANGAPPAPWG